MNITFLIGNGFDLGLGLKTRYSDFYKMYLEDKNNEKNILKFKDDIVANIKNWSDFEREFGNYSLECETPAEYLSRFEDFVENFNRYLLKEERRAKYGNEDKIFETMETAFVNFYKNGKIVDEEILENLVQNKEHKINFISYNYTKCLDNCLNIIKSMLAEKTQFSIGEIIHVHGFLEENMIMGVNDSAQIANPKFRTVKSIQNEIIKPITNNVLKMNYDVNATRLINESSLICVYGMSLGSTDRKWWDLISKWLYNGSNRHLVLFVDNNKYNKALPYTWTRTIEDVEERFLSYSTLTNESKEKIASRIHYQINNHIFEMEFIGDDILERIIFGQLTVPTTV